MSFSIWGNSIFNRMEVSTEVVCCFVAPCSLSRPWRATMGSVIWLAVCQQYKRSVVGGGGCCSPSVALCSSESVPDGCDLWTSQNGGTNERHSTCVRNGGTVFSHQSVFEEGASDVASQVLMGGESGVDAGCWSICCAECKRTQHHALTTEQSPTLHCTFDYLHN